MKNKLLFLVTLALLTLFNVSYGQKGQSISGIVKDAENGDFLPGAAIIMEGTNYATITDNQGNYSFYGLPAGEYNLTIKYIGYKDYAAVITLNNGEKLTHNVELTPAFIELHSVNVIGQRQGQMKALNQQKEADNQVNIVAQEQMERFPDLNTAEVLQRLPGVTISRDLGEGKFVSIRGTDPRFTQVKVNGEAIATPEDEERFVALNVISASQLSSIEVTKSPTPKMDGDAIGGVVNLKTRSAFDANKPVFRVTLGGGWQNMAKKPSMRGDVVYAQQLGKSKKFGISFSANYQLQNKGAHGIEPRWSDNFENILAEKLPMVFSDIEMKHYVASRERYGFGGEFEYRPNSKSKFRIGGMYNKRNDDQARNTRRVRANKGQYINSGLVYNARGYLELHDRLETQEIYAINGTGEHDFGWLQIDYNLAYSYGKQEKPGEGQIKAEFQSSRNFSLGIDTTDYRIPKFTYFDVVGTEFVPIPEDTVINPDNYVLDQLDWRKQHTTNQDIVGSINFTLPYNLAGNLGSFQFGGKARIRTKDRDNERIKNRHTDVEVLLPDYSTEYVGPFLQDNYLFGALVNQQLMRDFYATYGDDPAILEPEYRWVESLGETYYAEERVMAGYGMFRQNFGNLLILGGLRFEHTMTKYDGVDLELDSNGEYISHKDTSSGKSYVNFFPNLQGRWKITPSTNARASVTTGIMRPNYYSLIPYRIVSDKDRTILLGNPDLKPTKSINIDLGFEHYFQKVGIASVALFAKQMEDMAYSKITRDTTPGDYYNWESVQVINGGTAQLIGIELNWAQQFTFLPGFANGFGIYLNYTHNEAIKSEIFGRELGKRIPGLAPDVGNVALTYEKYGITARLAYNYSLNVLEEIGEIEAHDIWVDRYNQLDFSGAYQVTKGLEVFAEVTNILNSPSREYYGRPDLTYALEYTSWTMTFGLKWKMQ